MSSLAIEKRDEAIVFKVKVVPGSSRLALCGIFDGMLKIKLSAPPEKGRANKCLIDFLASRLGVKKTSISIIAGHISSIKQMQVLAMSADTLLKKLELDE